jgi:cell division protein FtsB
MSALPRPLTLALLVLLGVLQWQLWLGDNGQQQLQKLQAQLERQRADNDALRLGNVALEAELDDLRQGLEMVEERARSELGLIKPDEIFVQYGVQRTATP